MTEVVLDGQSLSTAQVAAVADGASVRLAPEAAERMRANAAVWARDGDPHLLRSKWSWLIGGDAPESHQALVTRFVVDHCAGVGEPLPVPQLRALMVVRANVLAAGMSGVRPVLVERLLWMLREGVHPVVPSHGAVGAAGSAALAHVARVALGLGGARLDQESVIVEPLVVNEKEALSLINGSSLTTALGALAVERGQALLRSAEAACALSMEVIRADRRCLDARAAAARRHPGIGYVAGRLRAFTEGSELVLEGNEPDAFCVRCAPTVLGAAHDALAWVTRTVELMQVPGVFVIAVGTGHLLGERGMPALLAREGLRIRRGGAGG